MNHRTHTQTAKPLSVKHSWKLIQFKLDLKWKTHPFNDGNEIIIEISWTAHKMTGIFHSDYCIIKKESSTDASQDIVAKK